MTKIKKLFIYYSLTGNGDLVAKKLDKKCNIRKIKVKKELPESFALKMIIGGFKAVINYKEKLIDFDNNINNYDEIIIGTPIWNDRISTPVATVLRKLKLNNKKLTFILYSGGGETNDAREYINKRYKDAKIIELKEPKKYKNELDKLNI